MKSHLCITFGGKQEPRYATFLEKQLSITEVAMMISTSMTTSFWPLRAAFSHTFAPSLMWSSSEGIVYLSYTLLFIQYICW
jgi:hypothetical protein